MDNKVLTFESVLEGLRDPSESRRKTHWLSLPNRHNLQRFTRSEFETLSHMLPGEASLDCRTCGTVSLMLILHSPGGRPLRNEKLSEWLFHPFLHGHSLVLSVSEERDFRDGQAQVEIARKLALDRYAQTKFHHVPHERPDWGDAELDHARGICFIGRPGMFQGCGITRHFPELHFSIEPVDEKSFCVMQTRPQAGALEYKTEDRVSNGEGRRRKDYAIVQRFVIRPHARDVTVVVIAGGSSLGTLGAARWINEFEWTEEKCTEYLRLAGAESLDRATFEALLEVPAVVNDPPRPWKPESIVVKKLFLNRSRNLYKDVQCISLATELENPANADDVRYILFDGDEMQFSEKDKAALIAFCLRYLRDHSDHHAAPHGRSYVVKLRDLTLDASLWPQGVSPIHDGGNAGMFFQDHLRRRSLSGCVEISNGAIKLLPGCAIKRIPANPRA